MPAVLIIPGPQVRRGEFTWLKGPEGSNRYTAPKEGEGWGQSSIAASQVSSMQVSLSICLRFHPFWIPFKAQLRDYILRRDGLCIITSSIESDAAHSVLKNRTDVSGF